MEGTVVLKSKFNVGDIIVFDSYPCDKEECTVLDVEFNEKFQCFYYTVQLNKSRQVRKLAEFYLSK